MARPRTYDPDEALDAAMLLFWKRGFAEASYDDLTKATGVSRKSLYATFGDKRSLFLKSLERYRRTQAVTILSELDSEDASLATITALFEQIGAMAKSPAGRTGCLMANTANDETAHDPDVHDQIERHLSRTSARFRTALGRAGVAQDRAGPLGDYLTGLLQGLFVLAHAGAPAHMIDATVSEGLRAVQS
jgi:TetR/AcrR family transcriptional regulator, transcriptional repressor for nem operon